MSLFEGENMQTQYYVLRYRIELYFNDYKLVIEIDENKDSERSIDYEIKIQKAIEQELGCIRIDPEKEEVDNFKTVNEIFRHIKQSTKKTQNKTSAILLRLEFKSKAIKFIV